MNLDYVFTAKIINPLEKEGHVHTLDESVKLTQKGRETCLQKYKTLLSR